MKPFQKTTYYTLPLLLSMLLTWLTFSFLAMPIAKAAPVEPDLPKLSVHSLISATKTADPIDLVSANGVLTYTIVFSSDIAIDGVIISDTVPDLTHYKPNSISSEPKSPLVFPTDMDKQTMFWTVPKLLPNTLITLTFAVIVNSPISNGLIITNQAYINEDVVTQTNTVVSSPTLAIAQRGPIMAIVGDNLVYTIRYTNSGTMTATEVIITNSLVKELDAITSNQEATIQNNQISWAIGNLPPGKGMIILTTTAKLAGQGVNQLSMSSHEVATVMDTISLTVTAPAIALSKIVEPSQAKVGDTITYTYHITNMGDITLSRLFLRDDKLGSISLITTTLLPQQSINHTISYRVKLSDAPGPLVNLAIVSGQASVNSVVTATAQATVNLMSSEASLALTKQADHITATIDEVVVYTYNVTNTSNITLLDIQLRDDKISSFKPIITTLAPEEGRVFTAMYTITVEDFKPTNGLLINIATVSAKDLFGTVLAPQAAKVEIRLIKPTIPVYLPLIIKQPPPPPTSTPLPTIAPSPTATSMPMTTLYINSDNTGGISSVEIRDPNNNNKVLLQCGPIGNNVPDFLCGQFITVESYTMIAITNRCGRKQATFQDATPGGIITRRVFCN